MSKRTTRSAGPAASALREDANGSHAEGLQPSGGRLPWRRCRVPGGCDVHGLLPLPSLLRSCGLLGQSTLLERICEFSRATHAISILDEIQVIFLSVESRHVQELLCLLFEGLVF